MVPVEARGRSVEPRRSVGPMDSLDLGRCMGRYRITGPRRSEGWFEARGFSDFLGL